MKQFLLLRNNQQSGPYSLQELINLQPRPLDLIWIENVSTQWLYASEMKDLEGYVNKEEKPASEQLKVFVSMPSDQHLNESTSPIYTQEHSGNYLIPVVEMDKQPQYELKERNNALSRTPVWQKRIFHFNEAFQLAAILIGVVVGAFIIKKATDGSISANEIVEIPVANLISTEKQNSQFKNALVTEIVTPEPVGKMIPKSVKPKDIKRQIKVFSNEYKTGMLGGISDLNLTLMNASPHFVDRVVVDVKYYKKNGELIDTKSYVFKSIQPNSSSNLAIPQSRRGVKVKTSVKSIYSKEYKAALKQV